MEYVRVIEGGKEEEKVPKNSKIKVCYRRGEK